jgi:hypothetical protein
VGSECIGFFVDVAEGDVADADGGEQLVALPVDPGVADGAARVVRDDEARSRPSVNDIISQFQSLGQDP